MKFKSKKVISSTLVTSAVCPALLEAQTLGGTANAVNTPDTQVFSGSKLRALSGSAEGNGSLYVLVGAIVLVVGFSALFYFLKKYRGESAIRVEDSLKKEKEFEEKYGEDPVDKRNYLSATLNLELDLEMKLLTLEIAHHNNIESEIERFEKEWKSSGREKMCEEEFNKILEKNYEYLNEIGEKIKQHEGKINILKKQLEEFGNIGVQFSQLTNVAN